jgi:hypothetical protein
VQAAVYVYKLSAGTYGLVRTLTDLDGVGLYDGYATSLAMSNNGSTGESREGVGRSDEPRSWSPLLALKGVRRIAGTHDGVVVAVLVRSCRGCG